MRGDEVGAQPNNFGQFFCLLRSPDHGTVKVVVVVVVGGGGGAVVGTIFDFDFFFSRWRHFYERTFIWNIEVMNCTNFGIVVTSNLAKNGQKRL